MPEEKPLESWKEIAAYLGRDMRTLRRWEKKEKLPVHRHLHQARASTYAYPSELDAWRASRQPAAEAARPTAWGRPARAMGVAAVLLLALLQAGSGPILTKASAAELTVRRVWAGNFATTRLLGGPSPDGRYVSLTEHANLAVLEVGSGQVRSLTGDSRLGRGEFAVNSPILPRRQTARLHVAQQ